MINFHSNEKQFFDTICIPFWIEDEKVVSAHETSFLTDCQSLLSSEDFTGKTGEIALVYPVKKSSKRIVLLGLGQKKLVEASSLLNAYSQTVKLAKEKKIEKMTFLKPSGLTLDEEKAMVESIFLSNYAFDEYKTKKSCLLKKIGLFAFSSSLKEEIPSLEILRDGVFLARDLVSSNADSVTPPYLAKLAGSFTEKFGKKVKISTLGKNEIIEKGLGLLHAVAKGASCDPQLIICEYKGNKQSSEHTVIIGKGITYDTGGLFIKPRGSMDDMRSDMAGAATALATFWTAVSLGLKVNLSVVIAAAENAVSAEAFKPGDVYKSYEGKTVEIVDTDAEGRLVLADAIAYTNKHLNPSVIIDFATLTGAMMVALGQEIAGVFSNDPKLMQSLELSSKNTTEKIWPMPLAFEYKDELKSDVADIRNKGDRFGGAITAALFLEAFVEKTSWAHLDIAGPSFYSKDRYFVPKNGTGFGVRLMIDYLKRLQENAPRRSKST